VSARRVSLFAALAVFVLGCGRGDDPAVQVSPPAVVVIQPQRGDAIRAITLPGDLVGFYESSLFAKVTGYLKSISVDKGDWVKAGQVLAEIEVPELRQRLERARADLEIQRVTYQRLEKVWKSDPRLVAREDVDVAEGKFHEAQAETDELQAMVDYTKIIAPFEGVITARFVDPGALIKAVGEQSTRAPTEGSVHPSGSSAPLVSLARIDRLRTYLYVPEREVSLIRRGMPATLTLAEFPGRKFEGKVTRFATSLDLSTRTMLTEVDIDNPTHELYPGMYANVLLELERHPQALEVPAAALGREPQGAFVYEVAGGRIIKIPVTVGINTGSYAEVTSGLRGSEQIIANLSPALTIGEMVRPVTQQNASAPGASNTVPTIN
jgi:membrane fusion protein, multidrug efflux system